jgi:replication factor A2
MEDVPTWALSSYFVVEKEQPMDQHEGGFIQSSPKREFTGVRTLRSFSIKQLNEYELDEGSSLHRIDTAEVTSIQVIGWVRSTKTTHAGSVFVVEDGTGSIDCSFWSNGAYEEEQSGYIEEGNLLRVDGAIRTFNGKKSIAASHVMLIDDPNYITYHFLSCIHQHLFYTNRLRREEIPREGSARLSRIQEDILECYRRNQDENGLDINVVVKMLRPRYPEEEVRENIETLLNDCHLYIVDGLEYKTTL